MIIWTIFKILYLPSFLWVLNENLLYHIIVATKENQKGIVKLVNSYPLSIPKADKLILAFPDREELQNIDCEIPFLYTSYPELEVLNDDENEENTWFYALFVIYIIKI